jgi:hypothetical protein
MSGAAIQVRIVGGKSEPDLVDGPEDAAVIVRVERAAAGLEPSVAFMQGKLKSEGPTGPLLAALADGSLAARIGDLVGR